jgi:hypothetical protein
VKPAWILIIGGAAVLVFLDESDLDKAKLAAWFALGAGVLWLAAPAAFNALRGAHAGGST